MTVRRSAAARPGEADARLQALGQVLAAQAARDGGREGVVEARVAREDRPDVGADGVGHAGQDEVGQRGEARLRRHRLAEGLRLRDAALLVLELADEGLELAALPVELAVLALEPHPPRLELVVAVLERIGHGVEAAHHRAELRLRVVGPLHARVEVAPRDPLRGRGRAPDRGEDRPHDVRREHREHEDGPDDAGDAEDRRRPRAVAGAGGLGAAASRRSASSASNRRRRASTRRLPRRR